MHAYAAVVLKPSFFKAWTRLGQAHAHLGYLDKATSCFKQTLKLDYGNKVARANLDALNGALDDKANVPEGELLIPFGQANVVREGRDITLVGTSSMVGVCAKAAEILEADGISAEVIDPRTIVPLDEATIVNSAKKTSRAIVVDEGHQSFGVTGEIASRIAEKAFYYLDAPVQRMGAMDVPIPFSPALEDLTVPTPEGVADRARALVRGQI